MEYDYKKSYGIALSDLIPVKGLLKYFDRTKKQQEIIIN